VGQNPAARPAGLLPPSPAHIPVGPASQPQVEQATEHTRAWATRWNTPHFHCSQILVCYNTSPCMFGSSKKIKPGSSWNVFKPFSIYSPNQKSEPLYGNFKYNHAIMMIPVHNLGKEGQCEFWGICQNFANKFGSQINSNYVSNLNFNPKGKLFPIF
jgi:hypothetical protein